MALENPAMLSQHALFKRVLLFMQRTSMMEGASHIDVALSGGVDSVCLLAVLCLARQIMQTTWTLRAHHVRHGLRKDDSRDERTARDAAQTLGVPFTLTKLSLGPMRTHVEECAREARYRALFERARKKSKNPFLAVAHHGDENLETALWRLGRGCGLEGLCLSPRRVLDGVTVVRPLLPVSKAEIVEFVRACGLTWTEDPTNASSEYRRNRLRHSVLPLLIKEASAPDVIYRSLLNIRSDAEAESSLAQHFAKRHLAPQHTWFCPWPDWNGVSREARAQILRHAARCLMPAHEVTASWIEKAVERMDRRAQSARLCEDGIIRCMWSREGVSMYVKDTPKNPADPYRELGEFSVPIDHLQIADFGHLHLWMGIARSPRITSTRSIDFDAQSIRYDRWSIRPASDFQTLLATDGREVKMREALRSQGVPDVLRPCWPVLCNGPCPLWILGGMRSLHAPMGSPGKNAVFVDFHPAIEFATL